MAAGRRLGQRRRLVRPVDRQTRPAAPLAEGAPAEMRRRGRPVESVAARPVAQRQARRRTQVQRRLAVRVAALEIRANAVLPDRQHASAPSFSLLAVRRRLRARLVRLVALRLGRHSFLTPFTHSLCCSRRRLTSSSRRRCCCCRCDSEQNSNY